MKRLILLIVFMMLVLTACGPEGQIHPRDFIMKYPAWKIKINGKQISKYDFVGVSHVHSRQFIYLKTDKGEGEIYLNKQEEEIPNTGWGIYVDSLGYGYFFPIKEKKEPKQHLQINKTQKSKRKEDRHMTLSLGTWILLILAMVIVAKLAHKISLKTIFRPTKRSVKHVKEEWKES